MGFPEETDRNAREYKCIFASIRRSLFSSAFDEVLRVTFTAFQNLRTSAEIILKMELTPKPIKKNGYPISQRDGVS
jgi:hypothetical protein